MRFHTTLGFSERCAAYEAAYDAASESEAVVGSPESLALGDVELRALDAVFIAPAATPEELKYKLQWFIDRELCNWQEAERWSASLLQDCAGLQRMPVTILEQFNAWRAAYEKICFIPEEPESEREKAFDERSVAFNALMAAPCTTPGDFIVKAYVNLLEDCGHTWFGEGRDDGTGSIWDVDIDRCEGTGTDSDVYNRSVYQDLSDCDLGACLLAFGKPEFDAEAWMERADALRLGVRMVVHDDSRSLIIDYASRLADRSIQIIRGQNRLERIFAYGGAPDRLRLICDEIAREWPQLISRSVSEQAA